MPTVRRARNEDYDGYVDLAGRFDAVSAATAPAYYGPPKSPARTRPGFEALLASPNAALFVADTGGWPVGYALVELRHDPPAGAADPGNLLPQAWANVLEIIVAEAWRRGGTGGALLAAARAWARERGCRELRLSVFEGNAPARAFYRALGFAPRNTIMAQTLDGPPARPETKEEGE